jgi:LemA protein
MPEVLPVILVILAIIVAVIGYSIAKVNSFKQKQVKIEEALSGIDVALQKRYDALTKMLDVAKSYAKFEKETILEAIKLRQGSSLQEKAEAEKQMNLALKEISIVAEQYPALRSSEQSNLVQRAIVDAEEHIQAARRAYNANVSSLNKSIVVFPASIIAKYAGIEKADFFEASEERKEDVNMSFEI